ncbi:Mu-like prophage major head subunit gpT family protein [Sedimentitalea sp. JM2-8]|uniref:Mu-like prophage major head subunit gpT family protein n=1 Tax=Sedimentitalea xiamensis TaxID=3050037 RepID=A0ABT7FD72_9RHOB|nr:Mu-like prophage major head subunit gpT family protein [Sedimentitalea xiamensis]MDK3072764.1 Mu-like prophage major head subunit gpT family protein [Sedimentitalea xiamensis]
MLINAQNLDILRVGFHTAFKGGLGQASTAYSRITTEVTSTQKEQKYGWLGKMPNVREWIGPRAVQNLQQHDYAITEKPWELTIGVGLDDIETDNLGIYTPMFTEMGMSTGSKKDLLCFEMLKNGFTGLCYDGQSYFDTDHPVLDEAGEEISVANTDGGSGTPWFLIDSSRSLKPIILQKRKDFEFVAKDDLRDDNVFTNKEFVYGADARFNAGYGFWQFAWGSKQTLDAAHYATARSALSGMKGDHGRPLGIMPNLLVVPPALESAGRKILNSEFGAGGETNEWKGTAELLVVPWLA